MAKWYGGIGFECSVEKVPGVWVEEIQERPYFGDLIRNTRRWQSGEYLNDNLTVSNQISVVADPFACQNFHRIRYVEFMGAKWKVSSVEVQYPRLVLEVGEVYNEQDPSRSSGCT